LAINSEDKNKTSHFINFKFGKTNYYKSKKGKQEFTFFAPNLTMNLTYLCYGMSQIYDIKQYLLGIFPTFGRTVFYFR